jgi:hypothetical protein
MNAEDYRSNALHEFRRLKKLAEGALSQIPDEQLFKHIDTESNSIGVIVKHMAGNMRSRWRDFLTTDGEKPDRHRDLEFVVESADTREDLVRRWEEGWRILFDAIEGLKSEDLNSTVNIRSEPHSVLQAINRQLTHYAYHVGQIVFLAKHFAGDNWQTLSVPKGKSEKFRINPKSYLEDQEG